jgi:YHS domain-containing protein
MHTQARLRVQEPDNAVWFRTILIFLLFLLLARAIWRLLHGVVQGASGGTSGARAHRPASPPAMKMARDPVCGTYVVPGKALELARGRETIYFCSEKCRDQWAAAR